jgi:hypothetical protein
VIEQVEKTDGDITFVLKDFHDCWSSPQVKRKLRSAAQRLRFTRKSIIVISPTRAVPDELADSAVVIELPLPDSEELDEVLAGLTQTPGLKVTLTASPAATQVPSGHRGWRRPECARRGDQRGAGRAASSSGGDQQHVRAGPDGRCGGLRAGRFVRRRAGQAESCDR